MLGDLGWNETWANQLAALDDSRLLPGRIAREHRGRYETLTEHGSRPAVLAGRMLHASRGSSDLPAVGDWVAAAEPVAGDTLIIKALLPRRTRFSRKAVLSGGMPDLGGRVEEQVLVANVDTIFLVTAVDGDFSVGRLERYLAVTGDSGSRAVILLNKIDKREDYQPLVDAAQAVAGDAPVLTVSALSGQGVVGLTSYLGRGETVAFLGSSGVGKSSLINALLGEARQNVRAVRAYDDRGRHTTTVREMIPLPTGGVLIDTPGLRGIQPWGDRDALDGAFPEIEQLAAECRFRDCRHAGEPGCAVGRAIEDGRLDERRLKNYQRLLRERRLLTVRREQRARMGRRRRR